MPIKKFKANVHNSGTGDVLIQSSTSYYTSRGLVQKTKASTRASSANSTPNASPSKSQKNMHVFTPCHEQVHHDGFDYDAAMMEPLKLPQSKVRRSQSWSLGNFNYFATCRHKMITSGNMWRKESSTSHRCWLQRLAQLCVGVVHVAWQRNGHARIAWGIPSFAVHAVDLPMHAPPSTSFNNGLANFIKILG